MSFAPRSFSRRPVALETQDHFIRRRQPAKKEENHMELLEIRNADGSGTGQYKDASEIHRDGNLHGRVQIWFLSEIKESGNFSLLIRKRSAESSESPGLFTALSTGHVAPGETFEATAKRLLVEDLEMVPPKEFAFQFDYPLVHESEINGQQAIDREFCRVFLLTNEALPDPCPSSRRPDLFAWCDAQSLLSSLREGDPRYSIDCSLCEKIIDTYAGTRQYTIHITDCWSAPSSGGYAGSDEWTYDQCYSFFGTKEEAMKEGQWYVRAFHDGTSPYLASVIYWLT